MVPLLPKQSGSCCLPDSQCRGGSQILLNAHVGSCWAADQISPPQVSTSGAERECHAHVLPLIPSRRQLPRADGVSPARPGWKRLSYTARIVSSTTRLSGIAPPCVQTHSRSGLRGGSDCPSHGIPRDVQLEHGWARSHLSFLERQKLQLVWGCRRRRGACRSASAAEFDMRRFMVGCCDGLVVLQG